LHLAAVAAERGTRHALSDIATAVRLSHAAAESALLNVDVNAKLMKNAERSAELTSEANALRASLAQAAAHAERALAGRAA
jgi:formiminotetrahydrofolate cyclodeaminase